MKEFDSKKNYKYEKYEGNGISAPQVLRFLDTISTFLKGMTTDIDAALDEIQVNFNKVEKPKDEEETKDDESSDLE